MTWVIVRHWTRKFLIVAISSDYFKHVRILVLAHMFSVSKFLNFLFCIFRQTRSSEKTEIQVLTTGRLSSL
ncbi:unnamed protein product [Rhizophagus irregularis]|nr:unnamed protein product [Rhizophagus irregularis]